jgi:tRNA uridine 5-carboxymethylaminomethyl modification enzyme
LFLRQDNAEARLMPKGRELGLVDDETWERFLASSAKVEKTRNYLQSVPVTKEQVNPYLTACGCAVLKENLKGAINLLKRPQVDPEKILELVHTPFDLNRAEKTFLFAQETYQGFFERQQKDIDRQRKMESVRIPMDFDYFAATAISMEGRQQLHSKRPLTLGDAQRLPGVRPSDISALIYYLEHKTAK